MAEMTQTPAHAKPSRRDHLWVLAVIAAFALFDVWESWTQVGNKSGFAHGTGWTLTVIVEVFAAYCLYAWFGAPGQRSRRFAMWSAIVALTLSLIGQGASVLAVDAVPPVGVRVFVRDLPVVVLAMIALLVHVRRLDRAEAEEVGRKRAEAEREARAEAEAADERGALRARLEALVNDLETANLAVAESARRENEAVVKAETLTRKLEAATARKQRAATGRKPARATGRKPEPASGSATAPEADAVTAPDDLDSEAKVLWYLEKGYSASKAGEKAGLSDSRGRQIARLRKPAQVED